MCYASAAAGPPETAGGTAGKPAGETAMAIAGEPAGRTAYESVFWIVVSAVNGSKSGWSEPPRRSDGLPRLLLRFLLPRPSGAPERFFSARTMLRRRSRPSRRRRSLVFSC